MSHTPVCKKGEILRVGYKRRSKNKVIKVAPTCIKDRGQPGKGKKLIKIPKEDVGLLSEYGYSLKEAHDSRVKSIKRAIKEHSELKVLRHINALRTLNKSNTTLYNKLNKDFEWIHKHYMSDK